VNATRLTGEVIQGHPWSELFQYLAPAPYRDPNSPGAIAKPG
jgi:hypothetical protein